MQRNARRPAGLHLGDQLTTGLLVITCIAVGDRQEADTDGFAAFLREVQEALPHPAFKAGNLRRLARSLRVVEREDEILPLALCHYKAKHIGICGTLACKADFHFNCTFQLKGDGASAPLPVAIGEDLRAFKAKRQSPDVKAQMGRTWAGPQGIWAVRTLR
jgi:hypothetical protein